MAHLAVMSPKRYAAFSADSEGRPRRRILHAAPIRQELFEPNAIEALIGPDTLPGTGPLPDGLLARFRARSLLARITGAGRQFVAGSFHATPGTGRFGPKPGTIVHNWK